MKLPVIFHKTVLFVKGIAIAIGLQKATPIEQYRPTITTIQLQANQQMGPSCGYHAACNAKAMQDLFYAKKPINEKTLQKQAQKYFKHIGKHELETYEIVFFGDIIGLENVYFLKCSQQNSIHPAGTVLKIKEDLETFLKNAKTQDQFLAQFICNTGGHWVLISVIKEPTNKISFYYLDSINSKLKPSSTSYLFMEYLQKAFST